MSGRLFHLQHGDALVVVDVQNDFLPGGSLAVPRGDEILPLVNAYLERFTRHGLPVYATRDWHPPDHGSFREQGGSWPRHCVADTPGASFAADLHLPQGARIVSKATARQPDAYSGFQGTGLADQLRAAGVGRIFVCGLATDYCVLNTVMDALAAGFRVVLLEDAVRAVDLDPADGARAMRRMTGAGAERASLRMVEA